MDNGIPRGKYLVSVQFQVMLPVGMSTTKARSQTICSGRPRGAYSHGKKAIEIPSLSVLFGINLHKPQFTQTQPIVGSDPENIEIDDARSTL